MSVDTMSRDLARKNKILVDKINEIDQLKTLLETSSISSELQTPKSIHGTFKLA
jgi:hypothetical protein